jgi:hypothetical protein
MEMLQSCGLLSKQKTKLKRKKEKRKKNCEMEINTYNIYLLLSRDCLLQAC